MDITTKPALIARINAERARLDAALAALAALGESRMLQPIVDDWTAKDLLTHIALWERLIGNAIETALRGETPPWPELGISIDQFDTINQREYDAQRHLPLAEARRVYDASFAATCALVERLSEGDLFDPQRFSWTRGHVLADFVRANTDEHYAEHAEHVETWLAAQGKSVDR